MRRLPVFGVLVLVCGEFTPLIVLAFPRVTPYVSRIPAQVTQLRKQVEARRARLAPPPQDSPQPENAAAAHIARTLDLVSRLWDRLGFVSVPPGAVRRARDAVRFLAVDDALLADAVEDQNKKPALDWRKGGPADFLVDEEVVLACEARGMDVLDVDVATLRRKLDAWVRHTTRGGDRWGAAAFEETQGRVRALLLGREQLKV
ncbi:hypothetical protein F4780DRAFT_758710 [Xylariomycetidae sp. FL0641]|nr:hypothetical protein F4780DRAFT_758710 [Xylariomycetidae sp. FL0641]